MCVYIAILTAYKYKWTHILFNIARILRKCSLYYFENMAVVLLCVCNMSFTHWTALLKEVSFLDGIIEHLYFSNETDE